MNLIGEHGRQDYNVFAKNRRASAAGRVVFARTNEKPSIHVWFAVVFALLVQQGAFVEMPALSSSIAGGVSTDTNILNTIGVAISAAIIGILVSFNARKMWYLATTNILMLLYVMIALISVIWSIHPDLTIRRGCGYVLSMTIAAFVAVRFGDVERMKLVSASFAVAAIGSFLYVAAFPDDGIMQIGELAGTWRGVFPHKNVLGPVMALAIFVELYILVASSKRARWRYLLLGLYLGLVFLTRSATALLMSTTYFAAAIIYLLWKRDRLVAIVIALNIGLTSFLGMIALRADPEFVLGLLGKDTSLTGRTTLWDTVITLIQSRPFLGYGYRAMWSHTDPYWVLTNELVGGWGVTNAENAFLEVALDLGAVGIFLIVAIIFTAFWRSIRCCLTVTSPLGWFSFTFFITAIVAGLTEPTLGQEQNIFWIIFSIMFFSCGQALWTDERWAEHRMLS